MAHSGKFFRLWQRRMLVRGANVRGGIFARNAVSLPSGLSGTDAHQSRRVPGRLSGMAARKPSKADASPETFDHETLRARVEAVLFISREPLPVRKITALSGCSDAREVRKLIKELNEIYTSCQRSFQIKRLAGGYQMLTRPQFSTWLRRLEHLPRPRRLSTPAMETLAVVAYRQPILKAEIEVIRGVNCGEMLKQLIERGFVRISGRSEDLGRPYLYSTTRKFLEEFGLPSLDALPGNDQLRGQGVPVQPVSLQYQTQNSNESSKTLSSEFPSEESNVKFETSTAVLDHEDENQLTDLEPTQPSKAVPTNFDDDDEDEVELDDFDDDDDDEEDELEDDFEDDDDDELEDDDEEWDDEDYDEEFDEDDEEDDDDEWEEVDDDDDEEEWEDDEDWEDDDEDDDEEEELSEGEESDEEEEDDEWN